MSTSYNKKSNDDHEEARKIWSNIKKLVNWVPSGFWAIALFILSSLVLAPLFVAAAPILAVIGGLVLLYSMTTNSYAKNPKKD